MADLELDGPELKKLLKVAKRTPLAFAFNPGKTEDEHLFLMHKRLPAAKLGKSAKQDGVGKKAAFGQCFVEGKVMKLTCEVVVPSMAKALKKYLKKHKVSMNVEIMDANGAVLESDIEDLPDDPELDADVKSAAEGAPAGVTAADLVARMKAAQQQIAGVQPVVAEKLNKVLKSVVEAIKTQRLDDAAEALAKIEAALAKLAGGAVAADAKAAEATGDAKAAGAPSAADIAKRLAAIKAGIQGVEGDMKPKLEGALGKVIEILKAGKVDAAGKGADQLEAALAKAKGGAAAAVPPPAPPMPPPVDPQLAQMATLLNNLSSQAGLLDDKTAADGILSVLDPVGGLIKAGDKSAAKDVLMRARALLEAAKVAQKEAKENADTIPDAPETEETPSGPEYDAWMAAFSQIEPLVNAALSGATVEDVDALRQKWNAVTELGNTGNHADALAGLPAIQAMLDAGREDGESGHLAEVPSDVRPFAVSRIKWNDTRKTMISEVNRLESMIANAMGDDEEFDGGESLTTHLERLDARLSDALDAVVNAPEGTKRDSAKEAAVGVLRQFEAELSQPFFADVDSNSGFGTVAVASTAKKALNEIAKVLA